jgi:DNA-binding NarL/FixJ family response regulator
MKILIIEDEDEMRRNMATVLRMEGYEVTTAQNGVLGVKAAQMDSPDLILCDIMMPALDGYGVLTALRADGATRGIPFIFLTAKGEKPDVRQGMNLGADDYLTKPIGIDELTAAIQARLARTGEHHCAAIAAFDPAPDFSSFEPLRALGLTPREAEVLLWVSQGKTNADISLILDTAESTVKKHMEHVLSKLGVDNRSAATGLALEKLTRGRQPPA